MSPEANDEPVPLASHEDVVKDKTLFLNTLTSFHFALGSKIMVPVIGGKELNLHALYVEVTRRGGFDKVVTEKKWREIGTVFDFSPTTTSASYALRKHYFTLLYRYELVYFFRTHNPMLNQTGLSSFQAEGTIDAKFDCGYLVSVKLGNDTLNGVLYHPGHPVTGQQCTAIVPYVTPQPGRKTRRRRAGDTGRPKPNRSGYNFFFAETHAAMKSFYVNRERELIKMIGKSWTNLPPEEKMVYQNYGLKDKERYHKELEEYKDRLKTGGNGPKLLN
ncbi:hypothetical protein ACJIZ3_024755 [Penstemon smallii]|uniref:High mobility group B protein 9 n=1 Tax=Penstemon smallii TaxID=265156 RepID=A0ABD3TSR3_9LAMI